ncbi:hypothetical protein IC229_14700 [Spirosoma sp. BT702]|uniref:Uncharacterized protein n=1 Tax=Spirosoma profusum TaxID=2771354 RepID=A0A927ASW6_9BACT|nr:hypothetical protein [Spirosoma profusum]MBD2701895.1 hypothetical protein [Spirosoma profusum]
MNPLLSIARFEITYQLRQPSFYAFALLITGQGIWYSFQIEKMYAYIESTVTSYLILSSLGVILAVVATLLAGQSLTKDLEYNTTPYLYTFPITSRMHFAGRFMGTYATALLLALFYLIGILLYSLIYSQVTLALWLTLLDGFVRLIAQNILIAVSITFSLTVFLRSIWGAYIGLFLIVLYFLLTETHTDTSATDDIWLLLDPFGVGMARESVESTAISDASSGLLSFSDMFLINRILWLGVALGFLAYAENTFSFEFFTAGKVTIVRSKIRSEERSTKPVQKQYVPADVQLRFGGWQNWRTLRSLTRFEFVGLIRQPVFLIPVGLLIILSVFLVTVLNHNPDFPELPTTARMTALRLPMGFFISIFLLVMTVELLFRERITGIWPIYDALPLPNFVILSAKLLALMGMAALLTLVLFLTGVGLQLSNGFYDIDWSRYVADLGLDGFARYCQLIALGALVTTLVNHRIMSHVMNLVIFAGLAFTYQFQEAVQLRYLYSFLPGSAHYSDLIGYGSMEPLRWQLHLMWWSVAGIFVILFLITWNRGVVNSLPERVRHWHTQFRRPYGFALLASGLFLILAMWQTQQATTLRPKVAIHYVTKSTVRQSKSGHPVKIHIQYHHPYQVQHMVRIIENALSEGEQLFGAYPHTELSLIETPVGTADVASKPGQIFIVENQGWIANNRQPDRLDYLDYLVSREVFKQWLVHGLPINAPSDGFVKQSLAEYLSLQNVNRHYSPERFRQRLAQRTALYAQSRLHQSKAEPTLLESKGNDGVERGRAALVLTSIGEVWGDKPLSATISQFYNKAVKEPHSATASAFSAELNRQLPDSLRYLNTYLQERLWFDFKISRVANLANGLTVEIITSKWRETPDGQRQRIPINDYVPLAVLDQNGHQLYRQLVHPHPDDRFVYLPPLPHARQVIIDPMGVWPEPNKRDNAKLF